MNVYIEQLYNW